MPNSHLEELTWSDIAKTIKMLDPELYEAIEDSALPAHWSLFKAVYPYGVDILKDGIFYLPNSDGNLVELADPSIPERVRQKLDYNYGSNPVCFVLKNSLEIFLTHKENIFTFSGPIPEGKLFGTSLVLSEGQTRRFHPTFLWNITAGARSMILLPKITEGASLERLDRAFKLNSRALIGESKDNWVLFRELAQRLEGNDVWSMEVLFFGAEWFNWEGQAATPFKNLLYKRAWRITEFWRNEYLWNMVFSIFMDEKMVKINPFVADTAKYLMYIAVGAQPGYAPSNDNRFAPITTFQEILRDVYHIENAPIFMLPRLFDIYNPKPVYFSLAYPNNLEFSPNNRKASTKTNDLLDVNYFLKKYTNFLKADTLKLQDSIFFDVVKIVQFIAYHNQENVAEIHGIDELFEKDSSFKDSIIEPLPAQTWNLPKNAPFLRGCIKVTTEAL